MPKKKDAIKADGGEDKNQRIAIVNAEKCKPKKVCVSGLVEEVRVVEASLCSNRQSLK